VWARLRKQIAVEREQLAHLLQVHEPLLIKCTTTAPDAIELSALAAMLHSFYTGSENIFKRIVIELGEPLPSGASWHRDLLEAMSVPSAVRPAAISVALRDRLGEYLNFRHVFRRAYSFQLRWDKMAPLVLDCEAVFRQLETELDIFLQAGEQQGPYP
jgi:hypothetical protein